MKSLKSFLKAFIFIQFVCIAYTGYSKDLHSLAYEILNNIYTVTADYRFEKPSLAFSSAKRDVAYYFPDKNTLTIEEAAIDVCRSLGVDSINALAFIIGHELAHVYQEEMRQHDFTSSFLTYDKGIHARIRTEKQADIQGALSSYLAGYKIQGVVPKLIDRLYKEYNLLGQKLDGYPGFQERQGTVMEVNKIVEDLVALWENAPYLSIIGNYDYASEAYEYISLYYRGSEVLNNTGINYLLEAINIEGVNPEGYVLPVEFDWETRMKNPRTFNGSKDYDFKAYTRRLQLLERAKKRFEEALHQNPNNTIASLNLGCCLVLMEEASKALALSKSKTWPENFKNKFKILESIALHSSNQTNGVSAKKLLDEVIKNGNYAEQSIAELNKSFIHYDAVISSSSISNCGFNQTQTTFTRPDNINTIQFNDALVSSVAYSSDNEYHYFEMASIFTGKVVIRRTSYSKPKSSSIPKLKNSIILGSHIMVHCPDNKEIQILNQKGELIGYVNYDKI